jgi:hypothetical protein
LFDLAITTLDMPASSWPATTDHLTQALSVLNKTHFARRFSAFDVKGSFIEPDAYESHLRGATVIMRFTMEKFNLSVPVPEGGKKVRKEVFVADIASVRVIIPPKKMASSGGNKLHRTDPFTPDFSHKGKKRKV